jgi:hypothetical protein
MKLNRNLRPTVLEFAKTKTEALERLKTADSYFLISINNNTSTVVSSIEGGALLQSLTAHLKNVPEARRLFIDAINETNIIKLPG